MPAGSAHVESTPAGSAPAGSAPAESTPAGSAAGGSTEAGSSGFGSGPVDASPADHPVTDADDDSEDAADEPPEEPLDLSAAALVAGLEDEVVVIDEQPRYHLAECRSLAGQPLIPLPAREAVELGFTPCGWCSPDRTLAARHREPAQ